MNTKVVVVDLDGTLSKSNTFHLFVRFLLKQTWARFALLNLFAIFFFSLLRAFKLITHKRWKYQILRIAYTQNWPVDAFIETLQPTLNQNILENINKFEYRILATAAPSFYADILAKKYDFTHCVATDYSQDDQGFIENFSQEKLRRVQQCLQQYSLKQIDLLMTDHIDDAPLIGMAQQTWLFNADNRLRDFVTQQNLTKQVKYIIEK